MTTSDTIWFLAILVSIGIILIQSFRVVHWKASRDYWKALNDRADKRVDECFDEYITKMQAHHAAKAELSRYAPLIEAAKSVTKERA